MDYQVSSGHLRHTAAYIWGMTEDDWVDESAGAAAEMVPFVGPVLGMLTRRASAAIRAEWQRNGSTAMRAAERVSGLSRWDLQESIADNPRLVPLLTRVLYQATMTGQDRTLIAMGAALGDGVRSPEHADEAEMILVALKDMQDHHLQALDALRNPTPQPPSGGAPLNWIQPGKALNVEDLAQASRLTPEIAELAATGLTSAGFARGHGLYGGTTGYSLTTMGETLLAVLDALKAAEDAE